MFPFHSADPVIQAILHDIIQLILAIYNAVAPDPESLESLSFLDSVLSLREFAGSTWFDAAHGIAHGFAIVIDDLIDLMLRLLKMDPQVVRGDH